MTETVTVTFWSIPEQMDLDQIDFLIRGKFAKNNRSNLLFYWL